MAAESIPFRYTWMEMTATDDLKNDLGNAFYANIPDDLVIRNSKVERRLLTEYGAVFVGQGGVTPPPSIVFRDEREVIAFQESLDTRIEVLAGLPMELQSAAMDDLKNAVAEAEAAGLTISPRDSDSAKRSYGETVGLWTSRVEPALRYWVGNGKISKAEADRVAAMSPSEQVPEVLKLEEKGIYFAKDLSKSIIYSVAPPGTSQHLSMLAFDVKEFENEQVRAILAGNKWYQTVVSDLPHFTYLGADENDLPRIGLKKITSGDRIFWVPDI